jgi:hypothetical protein
MLVCCCLVSQLQLIGCPEVPSVKMRLLGPGPTLTVLCTVHWFRRVVKMAVLDAGHVRELRSSADE